MRVLSNGNYTSPAHAASGMHGELPACAAELGRDELLQCKVSDTASAWAMPDLDARSCGPDSCMRTHLFRRSW